MKAGDELTRVIDNIYSLQAVADKFQSREALSVIRDLTDGKLVEYSAEGFVSDAAEKIKNFIKAIFSKLAAFFKWIWNIFKRLFDGDKHIPNTPATRSLAKKNKKVAALLKPEKSGQADSKKTESNAALKHLTVPQTKAIVEAAPEIAKRAKPKIIPIDALEKFSNQVREYGSKLFDISNKLDESTSDSAIAELSKIQLTTPAAQETNLSDTALKNALDNYEKIAKRLTALSQMATSINYELYRKINHELTGDKLKRANEVSKLVGRFAMLTHNACDSVRKSVTAINTAVGQAVGYNEDNPEYF